MTPEREGLATTAVSATPAPARGLVPAVHQAKLRPAVNPEYLVPRPRLVALLDAAVRAPVTLVVAPAGSGKTSLLRDWVAGTALPHAWLSVDELDRDAARLWAGILAALEGIAPGCTAQAAALLRRQGSLLDAVGTLLDDLESRPYDARVLVIDDLQLVDDDDGVNASLRLFLQHLPGWLRVVVASRRLPRLPVDRLRARGMLGEVRFPELRFSFDEAAEMLFRLAPGLPSDQVHAAAVRAGGWAASIQLRALAARATDARATDDAAGPGAVPPDDGARDLEDYVWHEVLLGGPPDVVEVLKATAVVERVDPGLAQALTGRADAPDLLARAEESGLFTARIEPSGVYETHALVRESLVGLQLRRSPERVTALHQIAAGWYEEHGQPVPALEHLLRAGAHRDALRLLASCVAELYDNGLEATVRRTVAAIPEGVTGNDLSTTIDLTWCRLYVDRGQFVRSVDELVAGTDGGSGPDDGADIGPVLRARLRMLEAVGAAVRGSWADGAGLARSALATIGEPWLVDPVVRYGWNLVAREIALTERWDDASAEVLKVVSTISAVPERRLGLEGTRALGDALAGHPVDALRLVAGARQGSEQSNLTMLRAELLTAEAIARREIGDTPAAVPALLRLAATDCDPAPHCRLLACLELTRSWLDRDDLVAAERAFGQAAEIVDTEVSGPNGRCWLARTGTVLALADGRTDEARRWVAQVDDPFWAGVKTARVCLAEGDSESAADELRDVDPRCVRHHVVRDLLLSRASASTAEAESCLLRAAELAAAHGLVQTVAAEGPDVVESIERLAWRLPQPWLARLRRIPAHGAASWGVSAVELTRPLTERQLGILRMLPSRLTLREIADELFISVNTLKFHLKVVYRELGCGSRAEAAEVARALASPHRHDQPSITRRR
ncbi:LuxR C-terminal-related transcriptional regulator [Isoptericola sp. NEAU-Y5]|uniref:LuxR C-terminal-related transcriptional regulator n=1 Tax=Isoptericola luteus TaxID=2879484 RepID=A0ABS7ZIV2_9MICO|nr:LuxR C-terminal-related transcriptional regulator [Isoptericola sp. NEAU-Y5]MCA5894959.1 LuxR C-terminal-related transcriptional regulator [Isoptericola sp. NEAU-Y5]